MNGGMEAIYDDIPFPLGFSAFAPKAHAKGPMFSARRRLKMGDEPAASPPVGEDEA